MIKSTFSGPFLAVLCSSVFGLPGVSATEVVGSCENRGGYPWGWDPVALISCRLDEHASGCIDTDGDGWGWNGNSTCIAGQATQAEVQEDEGDYSNIACMDSDGDGWGWQHSTSVRGRSCFLGVADIDGDDLAGWPYIGSVSGGTIRCNQYYYERSVNLWVTLANGFGDLSWTFSEDGTGYFNRYSFNGDASFTWSQSDDGVVTIVNSYGSQFQLHDIDVDSWQAVDGPVQCGLSFP